LVAWVNFQNFLHYTAIINPWLPASWIPSVGWTTTTCEAAFGIALILALRPRLAAFASGLLTLVFALAMVLALEVKAALNYSVFAFSAGSFLLATIGAYPWSVDSLLLSNVGSAWSAWLYSANCKGSRALKLLNGSVCLFLRSRRAYYMRGVIFDSASNENRNSGVQWVFVRNSS
jgi:uncharacterized membrane protein YphA (DoxX/SURF4 family)